MCKKQTSVTQSSAVSDVASLNGGVGLPALHLWICVVEVLGSADLVAAADSILHSAMFFESSFFGWCVPPNIPKTFCLAQLFIFQDNETGIHIILASRIVRHLARTHRVDFDGAIERTNLGPVTSIRHVRTNERLADFFTKSCYPDNNALHVVFVS